VHTYGAFTKSTIVFPIDKKKMGFPFLRIFFLRSWENALNIPAVNHPNYRIDTYRNVIIDMIFPQSVNCICEQFHI